MIFLKAFLIGGSLCALFQLLWLMTKKNPGVLLKYGFVLSAIMTPLGITGKIATTGQCGFFLMVVGAGEATYSGTIQALEGNPTQLLQLMGVLAAILLIGTVSGYLRAFLCAGQRNRKETEQAQ